MEKLPLIFPLVFEKILEELPVQSLLSCRLVNKRWNSEASKVLSGKCTTSFEKWESLRDYCQTFENSNDLSVKFKSFNFNSMFFISALENEAFGDLEKLEIYLNKFESMSLEQVNELCITATYPMTVRSRMKFSKIEEYSKQDFLYKLIYSFPNLIVLKLLFFVPGSGNLIIAMNPDNFSVNQNILPKVKEFTFHISGNGAARRNFYNQFIQNVLQSLPNLKVLDGSYDLDQKPWEFDINNPFVKSFPVISEQLTSLTIASPTFCDSDIQELSSKSFPKLEKLNISIDMGYVTEDILKGLLINYSGSLKTLEVCFKKPWTSSSFPREGVVMRQLDKLIIENYCGPINWSCVPKLRKLKVNATCIDWQPHFLLPESSWSLKCLEVGPQEFSKQEILDWFCYLNELKIRMIEPSQLTQIFTKCKLLKKLKIKSANGVEDDIICGMPAKLLKTLFPLGNLQTDKEIKDMILFASEIKREFPCLCDLKDLEELTLQGDTLRISDASVLFGIAQCRKLRKVKLDSINLTRTSVQILKVAFTDLDYDIIYNKV